MRLLHGLGHFIAIAVITIGPAVARDASQIDGWDPFRPPVPDRVPDDYVKDKPYWRPPPGVQVKSTKPQPSAAPRSTEASRPTPAPVIQASSPPIAPSTTTAPSNRPAGRAASDNPTTAMAADKTVEEYNPFRPPIPDRPPDDFRDGRPYWLPGPVPTVTPTGFVGYSLWETEFGGRYVASTGTTRYDLFRAPVGVPSSFISRLTYKDLLAHSGELFGRVEHASGFFAKGFVGGGVIPGGSLQDEDFPPFSQGANIYSSTNSTQRDGSHFYGAIDLGWAWRAETFKTSFFVGYFHYSETLNAFGCTQTAANPDICRPAADPSTQVIRQETNWDALRLGFSTEWRFADRWKLTAEAAWLPYVSLDAKDTHFLRIAGLGCDPTIFVCDRSGPSAQNGADVGSFQLEAILSYLVTDALSVGVGIRYWNIHDYRSATIHFETSAISPFAHPQAINFITERVAGFVQASYKFGDLQPSGRSTANY